MFCSNKNHFEIKSQTTIFQCEQLLLEIEIARQEKE